MGQRAKLKAVRRAARAMLRQQRTPAGRMQALKEAIALGIFKRKTTQELLVEPAENLKDGT